MQQKESEPLDLPEGKKYTHRAHRFPGKFHPPLIKKILREHPEHEVVADPMCGSGTVGVEAAVSYRDAICVDIDPLSSLMTAAKSHPIDPNHLLELGDSIRESVGEMPEQGALEKEVAREEIETNLSDTQFGIPMNLFHWFEPYVAVGYSRLLQSAHEHISTVDGKTADAIQLALSAMVRRISRADPQPVSGLEVTKVRKKELEEGIDFDVAQTYSQVLQRLARGYRELQEVGELDLVEVTQADARNFSEICANSQLDPSMIITSPPYCNAIEYSRRHRLEYEWLGLFDGEEIDDPRDERLETSRDFFGSRTVLKDTLEEVDEAPIQELEKIISEIELEGKEKKANMLRKYFNDAYIWLGEIYEVLPSDGLLCMTVGPSTSYGRSINTPRFLPQIAKSVGFEEVSEPLRYSLTNNKMQYPTNGETTDIEVLFKLTPVKL